MNIFQELVETNEQLKRHQAKYNDAKRVFEEQTMKLSEDITALKEREKELREQVTAVLKENNETSVSVDDKIITRAVKNTLRITDPHLFVSSIINNTDKLAEIGYNADELKEEAFKQETVIVPEYKKTLLDIASKYKDIEDELLNGVENQETQFITIKKINN